MNRDEFYTAFKHDIITSKLKPGELLIAHVADHRDGPRVVAVERSQSHLHQAILTAKAGVS